MELRTLRLTTTIRLLAVIVVGAVTGCSYTAPEPLPFGVVLITVDSLRSDRLGAYGYASAKTPSIDEFASDGALFENAYSDISWTTASVASIMTGLYTTGHGLNQPWLRLPENQLTIAEVYRGEGYETAAVVGIFSLDAVYGLDQGFDSYDDDFSLPSVVLDNQAPASNIELKISDDLQEYNRLSDAKQHNDAYKEDDAVTDSALAWLRKRKSGPFFLWVHYFGPHERLIIIKGGPDNRRRIIEDYDRDLAVTDAAVGRLLKGIDDLGLRSNTLVVLSSDHGQTLGERGLVGHGTNLYEPEVRIPLILRLPSRIDPGLRLPQVVRSIDIYPTLLDYAGIAREENIAGLSLRSVLDGDDLEDRPAFMDLSVVMPALLDDDDGDHYFGRVHMSALRQGKWKLIQGELGPSCWEGGSEIEWDFLRMNAMGRKGSIRLPDKECTGIGFTRMFDVSQRGRALGRENRDMTSRKPERAKAMLETLVELASGQGEAERFDLTPEQEQKLKSLGYLR